MTLPMLTIAPPPALDHVPAEDLAGLEHGLEVDRQDAVPVGVGGVEERAAGVHAGAVDQDVDPAGLLERRRPAGSRSTRAEVTLTVQKLALPPSCFECLDAGLAALFGQIGDDDVRRRPGPGRAHSAPPSTPAPPMTTAVWPSSPNSSSR